MPQLATSALLVLLVGSLVKLVVSLQRRHALKKIMPPGPPGWPILGNLFDVPKTSPHKQYLRMRSQYGPIFTLDLAGKPLIIVNGMKAAQELLERATLSDRPHTVMANQLLCDNLNIPFMPYGSKWRKLRRAAHTGFNVQASRTFQPAQEREAAVLVRNLMRDPGGWIHHIRRSIASAVLSVVYGWPSLDESSNGLVERMDSFMHRLLTAAVPGSFLVEIFPFMLVLPTWMASWKKWALEWHRKDTKLFESFMDSTRHTEDSEDGSGTTFVGTLLDTEKKGGLTAKEAAWLAGTMFGAGSDTTAASVESFLYAMTLHPDAMRKAQAEIDAVVGKHRLPTFDDQEKLPYLNALCKEVLRWHTVSGLLARGACEDDWYDGYFIPKGAVILFNGWGIHKDEEFFPEPHKFLPERFLDEQGQLAKPLADTHGQGHLVFGGGRRVCVGMHVANQGLFINTAYLLWAFDVAPLSIEVEGVAPSREDDTDESLLVRPKPFKCSIKPRRPDIGNVLGEADTTKHQLPNVTLA